MQEEQGPSSIESNVQVPEAKGSENPKRRRIMSLKSKKLWMTIVAAIIVGSLLVAGSYFYKNSDKLKTENSKLQTENNQLTDKISKYIKAPGSQELTTLTKGGESNTGSTSNSDDLGGTAKQINYATDSYGNIIKSQYAGGTYAPFYILNKYAIKVPNGVKMERDTSIGTDGILHTYKDEGGAGCGIEGIVTSVETILYSAPNSFEGHGDSSTSPRGIGCGGGWPAKVSYAKYTDITGITGQPYKYMEVVVFPCADNNVDNKGNCKSNDYDASKWVLYSGLVEVGAKQYSKGESIDYQDPARDLYNRDAYQVQFYVSCPGSDSVDGCDYKGYKNGYQAALIDANYTQLKGIIEGIYSF